MLNHLRADHTIKLLVLERQSKETADGRRLTVAAQIPHLVQLDVNPDRIGEVQENPTRSTAHVKSAGSSLGESRENLEPFSLPIALWRNQAIVGPPIIVTASYGIP